MSAFGDLWVSFRNKVVTDVIAVFEALEPSLKVAAVTVVESGVAAATASTGTLGDKFVAARNAVEASAASVAPGVAVDALHAATGLLVAQASAPAAPAP